MSSSSARSERSGADRDAPGNPDCDQLDLLSPTDSCRDRLAAFLFWNDFSGLEQALAVCRARDDVDLGRVRRWCRRTGHHKKWALLQARLRVGRST